VVRPREAAAQIRPPCCICTESTPCLSIAKYLGNPAVFSSVGNPDADLQDPHVFGPPGSGSIRQRYGPDPAPSLSS
jgi:hypothetical protein